MSSTNRSDARQEHISDYYVTPCNEIEQFIKELTTVSDIKFKGDILDPCAGGDSENPMSYPKVIKEVFGIDVDTIDIREDSLANVKEDFLLADTKNKYDIIITNPPFNKAREIITKSLEDVKEDGYVIMLLRLNFFGSKERKTFWYNNMPLYTFVHSKRMSFTKDKKTDSIEYMHAVWHKNTKSNHTQLYII